MFGGLRIAGQKVNKKQGCVDCLISISREQDQPAVSEFDVMARLSIDLTRPEPLQAAAR